MKIESGIPISKTVVGRETRRKWPFVLMDVGQSVLVPAQDVGAALNAMRAVQYYSGSKEFRYERYTDRTVRIWRTE